MSGRSADFTEFYAAAAKHDMKLYVAPATGQNSPDAYDALASVAKECNEPVTARIAVPGLEASVEAIFEDRALIPRDGRLQDVFAPLAVHVYKW